MSVQEADIAHLHYSDSCHFTNCLYYYNCCCCCCCCCFYVKIVIIL